MHMEGRQGLVRPYEAYKLRQVVGEWHEFMYDVEAHFGVGELPPSTQILDAAPPSVVLHATGDISVTQPTRSIPTNQYLWCGLPMCSSVS